MMLDMVNIEHFFPKIRDENLIPFFIIYHCSSSHWADPINPDKKFETAEIRTVKK